jgi:hypothetical protein
LPFKLLLPPAPSLVTSWLWEGYIEVLDKGLEGVLDENKKNLEDLNAILTGNDYPSIRRFCSASEGAKVNLELLLECLKNRFTAGDYIATVKVDLNNNAQIYGSRDFVEKSFSEVKKEVLSLQIMKVDRYQGISSIELKALSKQVTTYADAPATLLFLLGVLSTFSVRRGTEHYFILLSPTEYASAEKEPTLYLNIKNMVRREVRTAVEEMNGWFEEYVYLRLLLNKEIVERTKSMMKDVVSLRIVKISREGQTLKVYADYPLAIFTRSKVYENLDLIDCVNSSLDSVAGCASRFVSGKAGEEGCHAYMAIKKLYMYVNTFNPTFLAEYNREIATLRELKANCGKGRPKFLYEQKCVEGRNKTW